MPAPRQELSVGFSGAWVLAEGTAQSGRWLANGHPVAVAVNVSARQLGDPAFVDHVAECLDQAALPPHLLTVEITETALMGDLQVAADILAALRGLGVRLSVDDFGTGFASLSYLRQFPIDELKIDRSFVAGLPDPADVAIIASCVQLAEAMGITTVAEGVETVEQRDLLVQLGATSPRGGSSAPEPAGPRPPRPASVPRS